MYTDNFSKLSGSETAQIEKIARRIRNRSIEDNIFCLFILAAVFAGAVFSLHCVFSDLGSDILINAIVIFLLIFLAAVIICAVLCTVSAVRTLSAFSYHYTPVKIEALENTTVSKEEAINEYSGIRHNIVRRVIRKVKYNVPAQTVIAKADEIQFRSFPLSERIYDKSVIGKEAIIILYPKQNFSFIVLRDELAEPNIPI